MLIILCVERNPCAPFNFPPTLVLSQVELPTLNQGFSSSTRPHAIPGASTSFDPRGLSGTPLSTASQSKWIPTPGPSGYRSTSAAPAPTKISASILPRSWCWRGAAKATPPLIGPTSLLDSAQDGAYWTAGRQLLFYWPTNVLTCLAEAGCPARRCRYLIVSPNIQ